MRQEEIVENNTTDISTELRPVNEEKKTRRILHRGWGHLRCFSCQVFHNLSLSDRDAIRLANCKTFHTSENELARPRLMRTTPSSWPTRCSKSFSVIPGSRSSISFSILRIAAAPPGLQTQPVRSDILHCAAACSINELGIIWSLACTILLLAAIQ